MLLVCVNCSGFISSFSVFEQQTVGANVAGFIMIIIGLMFALCAYLDMIMLIQVCTFKISNFALYFVM